jgi:Uma2 family endonuclease
MSTVAPKVSSASGLPPLHRITVDEYERIAAAGALEDPSRVELIDGYMVDKMAKNSGHSYTTKETLKALDRRLPAGWSSRKEEPIRIPEFDEPEPDIAIVRGSGADYRHRIPGPADVALLVGRRKGVRNRFKFSDPFGRLRLIGHSPPAARPDPGRD